MKKLIFLTAIAVAFVFGFGGCENREDGCAIAGSYNIEIVDKDGNNLLDPLYSGNIVDKFSGEIIYNDTKIPLIWDDYQVSSFVRGGSPLGFSYPDGFAYLNVLEDGNYEMSWYKENCVLGIGPFVYDGHGHKWTCNFTVVLNELDVKLDVMIKGAKHSMYVDGKSYGSKYTLVVDPDKIKSLQQK